jgi:CheY-like chemotaxis protein
MNILIIDDQIEIRNCFRLFLERKGHTIYEYDKGTGAVDYALKMRPDLVLTDHNLEPEGPKGLEIAAELQREGQRVILMSGDSEVGGFAALAGVEFVEKGDIKGLLESLEVAEPDGLVLSKCETGRWSGREDGR